MVTMTEKARATKHMGGEVERTVYMSSMAHMARSWGFSRNMKEYREM
jgi:uncharacterized RmlC-like cupin family protein